MLRPDGELDRRRTLSRHARAHAPTHERRIGPPLPAPGN